LSNLATFAPDLNALITSLLCALSSPLSLKKFCYLLCGAWPLLIVSEKVLNDWNSANVSGFEYYSVGINKINSEKLKDKEPPKYFHIIVTGRCELDLDKMGIKIKKKCPSCGKVFFDKEPWEMNKLIIKESTWDKSDLFISELFPAIYLCTEKVIITACQNKHTNLEFIEPKDALTIMPPPKTIDYLKYCK